MRNFLVICTLVAATGGQWMVLQSAAWAGMIVSNLAASYNGDLKHDPPPHGSFQSDAAVLR